MAQTTRGVYREDTFFIKVTPKILYGFKPIDITKLTGVGTEDTTALGWLNLEQAKSQTGLIRLFTPKSPTPARYKKILNRRPAAGQRGSVSAYGNPDPAQAERQALVALDWLKIKDGSTVKLTANDRRETVGVPMETGGTYVISVDAPLAAAHAEALGLKRASDMRTEAERNKLFYGTTRPQPCKVRRVEGSGTATLPCQDSKAIELEAGGEWVIVHREKIALHDPDSVVI